MSQPTATISQGILTTIVKIVPSVLVIGALGAAWLAVHHMNATDETHDENPTEPGSEEVVADILTLPPGKVSSAQLVIAPVSTELIQHSHVVPGRITYDPTRHVEVRSPIDGVLRSVEVNPGDHVKKGQLLATVTSPEIGKARSELLRSQAEFNLVSAQAERTQEIAKNLEYYAHLLAEDTDIAQVEAALKNRSLGNFGKVLQPAHSKLNLTQDLLKNIQPLSETGAIAGKTLRERESQYEVARAEFKALLDQAIFDAKQSQRQATADLADAQRQVEIARDQLLSLVGEGQNAAAEKSGDHISELEVVATMDGTVEARHFAVNERVYGADSLFTLADTSSLYVNASIRENDWPAIKIKPGTEIRITLPALVDQTFHGHVQYVGREVAPDTNSVPVVASLSNPEGVLRPGMFARITLPISEPQRSLAVSAESIVHHDDREYVFVQIGEYEFQCVEVETGLHSDEWVEIRSGLQGNEKVVQKGAFLLKSEWLLEGEAE
ncbi:efflux RND transporter periplasmic adaptor subunit [Bremerella cremea]|nr:efflux RND transporter periplasmic adaptor subunit [Bremerella cremea]